jgi:hypothetical protein
MAAPFEMAQRRLDPRVVPGFEAVQHAYRSLAKYCNHLDRPCVGKMCKNFQELIGLSPIKTWPEWFSV